MMRDIQGRFRFLLALCAMSCLSYGGHVAAKKSSDVYTVRYSYEKQTRAGTKRYVLVPQIIEIASKKHQDFKKWANEGARVRWTHNHHQAPHNN